MQVTPLEKVVRDADIQARGHIFYKPIQLITFEDYINTAARSERDIRRTSRDIRNSAEIIKIKINGVRTK